MAYAPGEPSCDTNPKASPRSNLRLVACRNSDIEISAKPIDKLLERTGANVALWFFAFCLQEAMHAACSAALQGRLRFFEQ
jgi:hypothetical protein